MNNGWYEKTVSEKIDSNIRNINSYIDDEIIIENGNYKKVKLSYILHQSLISGTINSANPRFDGKKFNDLLNMYSNIKTDLIFEYLKGEREIVRKPWVRHMPFLYECSLEDIIEYEKEKRNDVYNDVRNEYLSLIDRYKPVFIVDKKDRDKLDLEFEKTEIKKVKSPRLADGWFVFIPCAIAAFAAGGPECLFLVVVIFLIWRYGENKKWNK